MFANLATPETIEDPLCDRQDFPGGLYRTQRSPKHSMTIIGV